MVNSMTAFSKYESEYYWGRVSWEIRSINQRYLDIHINLPNNFHDLLYNFQKKIKNYLYRGKIDCNLTVDINYDSFKNTPIINQKLAYLIIDSANWIKKQITDSGPIDPMHILSFPGVISYTKHNNTIINNELLITLGKALDQLVQHRKREGFYLKTNLLTRLNLITKKLDSIKQHIPEALNQKRNKILELMQNLSNNIDSIKLEQELLSITQKFDITEEIERLIIHIQEMRRILSQQGTIGKQLDFITQELQRESNTLTSKSINTHITHIAISIKVFIEQIREQIQNIE